MKKVILSLSILLSLSSFAQEKYQVEVEPAVKLNQSILSDYNSQIEKEVGRIYSKEEMFGMMNKMMNGVFAGSQKDGSNQMKEMMAHGMSFQSHTVNHPDLSTTDKATQKVELTDSIDFLENKLNTKVNTIAYPSGRYNQTTLDLAKKTYKLGLTTNEGLASAKDGLLSLNRVRILPTTTAKGLLSEIATDND